MKLYDMHMHSIFSFDSDMRMEDAAERSISLGFAGIAFTDHLDVNYMADGSDVYYDFGEYLKAVSDVKAKFEGKLDILSAVEVGLQPHVVDENIRRLKGHEFDYKIGSTHLISRIDPYDGSYFKVETDKIQGYRRYLNEVIKNINLYHDYNVLGHFDYLVRYGQFDDNTMYFSDFRDEIDEILKLIVNYGIGFEINTRSYDRTPIDISVIKRYIELGGETLVIGSDAHRLSRIGKNFASAVEILKYCGIKYIAHFRKGNPIYERID